jgi:hypothetical protein
MLPNICSSVEPICSKDVGFKLRSVPLADNVAHASVRAQKRIHHAGLDSILYARRRGFQQACVERRSWRVLEKQLNGLCWPSASIVQPSII